MQWLAEVCVRRPVFALMLITAMVVAGVVAFSQLGVDRLPRKDARVGEEFAGGGVIHLQRNAVAGEGLAVAAGVGSQRVIKLDAVGGREHVREVPGAPGRRGR